MTKMSESEWRGQDRLRDHAKRRHKRYQNFEREGLLCIGIDRAWRDGTLKLAAVAECDASMLDDAVALAESRMPHDGPQAVEGRAYRVIVCTPKKPNGAVHYPPNDRPLYTRKEAIAIMRDMARRKMTDTYAEGPRERFTLDMLDTGFVDPA